MDRMTRRGITECLISAILFGVAAPAASVLAGDLPALVLAGLLYLGAALAVVIPSLRLPVDRIELRAGRRRIAAAVIAGGAVGPVLLVAGLAQVDAATASILLNLELVATVVLARLFFGEHLGRRVVIGAGLVTAAGLVLVWKPDGPGLDVGGLLIVGACICWGLDNCVTATIDRIAPEHVVLIKGVVAGTVNLVLGGLLFGLDIPLLDVGAALAVGALGYGLSILLWVRGARSLGAARAQVIFATAPFIGVGLSWLALDGSVTGTLAVAVVVAAVGVAISLRSDHDHLHAHEVVVHAHEHVHDEHHRHHVDERPGRHDHLHRHEPFVHSHPHVPDLHHRHGHAHP